MLMAQFTAMVEQAEDGSWSACSIGEHTVLGQGATREEALSDLRRGIAGLIAHLRETGQPIPSVSTELVNIEVAA
jgi:predicted RNase H-like HicB family nuclease